MLRTIAIDDEPAALAILTRYAEKVPFVHLEQTFDSPTAALTYLHTNPVDLIFLDIQMPDLLGTEFARLVADQHKNIVFTTAFADYALEGYSLDVTDYLLKPIEFGRFLQACNRAYAQTNQQRGQAQSIFVKDGYDWVRVYLTDVLYMRSDTNLLFIHERTRQLNTRMTITDMLTMLPAERFIRVHKSYIVAIDAIQKLERHQLTVGNAVIPLAGSYREAVEQRLLGRINP